MSAIYLPKNFSIICHGFNKVAGQPWLFMACHCETGDLCRLKQSLPFQGAASSGKTSPPRSDI
jgi:hypothetical protein